MFLEPHCSAHCIQPTLLAENGAEFKKKDSIGHARCNLHTYPQPFLCGEFSQAKTAILFLEYYLICLKIITHSEALPENIEVFPGDLEVSPYRILRESDSEGVGNTPQNEDISK